MKTSNDDIWLAVAYFNLQAPQQHTPAEIVADRALRKRFLRFARRLLGSTEQAIFRRLVAIC
jgi:hypothetical protein